MPIDLYRRYQEADDKYINAYFHKTEELRMSAEDELRYGLAAREGDLDAREKLINSQLENVVYLALEYEKKGILSLEELYCEGNVAIMYAVDEFDPYKGRLSTLTRYWVEKLFKEAMKDEYHSHHTNNDFDDRYERLRKELKRKAEEELGDKNYNPFSFLNEVLSLNQKLDDDSESTIEDVVMGDAPNPADEAAQSDLQEKIQKILESYTQMERTLINGYFGLNGHVKCSIYDLSKIFGLTETQTKLLLNKTIRKLRTDGRFDNLI